MPLSCYKTYRNAASDLSCILSVDIFTGFGPILPQNIHTYTHTHTVMLTLGMRLSGNTKILITLEGICDFFHPSIRNLPEPKLIKSEFFIMNNSI